MTTTERREYAAMCSHQWNIAQLFNVYSLTNYKMVRRRRKETDPFLGMDSNDGGMIFQNEIQELA